MKISHFHRLLLRLGIAIVLMVLVSASWSPHLLKGNELLLVGGSNCTGSRTCEDDDCPPGCSVKKDRTCTKLAASTIGCWHTNIHGKCGQLADGTPCWGDACEGCNPCE